MEGEGKLTFTVWPAYIGLCNANLGMPPFALAEPEVGAEYQRGQITWEYRDGQIVGRARIICPMGEYTHFVYFQHPTEKQITGLIKMPHPLRCLYLVNTIDVDPIVNEDLVLNVPEAPP